jgi:hypothetical protein
VLGCKILELVFRPFAACHSEVQCMSDSPDRPLFESYRCCDCGSETGFRSRRRTLAERFILPLFLLQPVRCGECFRRDYRLIFTPVHDRMSDTTRMVPGKQPATSNRNVA